MKFNTIIVSFGLLVLGITAYSGDSQSGRVICSLRSENLATNTSTFNGFELVTVGSKDRSYSGTHSQNDLEFKGKYTKSNSRLDLEINALDEDNVVSSQLLQTEVQLSPGSFWHSKTSHANTNLDIYCQAVLN